MSLSEDLYAQLKVFCEWVKTKIEQNNPLKEDKTGVTKVCMERGRRHTNTSLLSTIQRYDKLKWNRGENNEGLDTETHWRLQLQVKVMTLSQNGQIKQEVSNQLNKDVNTKLKRMIWIHKVDRTLRKMSDGQQSRTSVQKSA